MTRFKLLFTAVLVAYSVAGLGGRTYTTPVVVPPEESAQVMAFGMIIVLNEVGNPSADSFFRYVVNTQDGNGTVINSKQVDITWPNIPAASQDKLRDLHSLVLTHAEAQGLIQAGADADDL